MRKDYAIVEDSENLVRDMTSGAVINTDSSALARAKAKKFAMMKQLNEQQQLKNDVESLKEDMNDIKSMLSQLLDRK